MHNVIVPSFHQSWQSTKRLFIILGDSLFSCQTCHQTLHKPACDAATLAPAPVPLLTIADYTVQVSKACTSICMWVRAMYKYHTVALSVAPKRAALAQAQSQLDATLAELAAAQAKLQARLSCFCLICVCVVVCVSVSVCVLSRRIELAPSDMH